MGISSKRHDKVVALTGAERGIGHDIALLVAAEGASVGNDAFAVRTDEIFQMSLPRPIRGMHACHRWTRRASPRARRQGSGPISFRSGARPPCSRGTPFEEQQDGD